MVAFSQIAAKGSSSIVAVAPGIAEALITTAAGLVAAVPALIAYNNFNGKVRVIRAEMNDFALEFLNLAERHFT
jgi:biopolymer transport protein TolQ